MTASQSRFTVAKLDAGMAILLTSDHHLIEFPSLLLPNGIHAGSIIDLSVNQNTEKEREEREAFEKLQNDIKELFGVHPPSTPKLSVRNITQTSIVLEWELLDLASADLRSIALYKNGSKLGKIPNATTTTTKLSGLALDTEYTFQLVLRTSAGTFKSENIKVKTHKMTNLSGLNVCTSGLRAEELDTITAILERIGAKPPHDKVKIDTTHFITNRGAGEEYKKAQTMNIPVVIPDFLEACENEGRLMRAGQYYLDSDPALRPARSALSRSTTAASIEPAKTKSMTNDAQKKEQEGTTNKEQASTTSTQAEPQQKEPEPTQEAPSTPMKQLQPRPINDDDGEESGPPQRARGEAPASSKSQREKPPVDPNRGIPKSGSQEFQKLASYLKTGEDEALPTPTEEKGKGVMRSKVPKSPTKESTRRLEETIKETQENAETTPEKEPAMLPPREQTTTEPSSTTREQQVAEIEPNQEAAKEEINLPSQVTPQIVAEAADTPLPDVEKTKAQEEEKFESVAL